MLRVCKKLMNPPFESCPLSVKDGVFRQYTGSRDRDSLWSFVDEKKWKSIEPVSKWSHPASIQMTIISWFFKISMTIRELHTRLVEDYGIPYWGSYILFALCKWF